MKRQGAGSGVIRALFLLAVPAATVVQYVHPRHFAYPTLAGVLACGPVFLWTWLFADLVREVRAQRRGASVSHARGAVWLASLIMACWSFMAPAGASSAPRVSEPSVAHEQTTFTHYEVRPGDTLWSIAQQVEHDGSKWRNIVVPEREPAMPDRLIRPGWDVLVPTGTEEVASTSGPVIEKVSVRTNKHRHAPTHTRWSDAAYPAGAIPLALVAKRRQDLVRQRRIDPEELQIDELLRALREGEPSALSSLTAAIGARRSGRLTPDELGESGTGDSDPEGLVAAVVENGDAVVFARRGGSLETGDVEGVEKSVCALAPGARCLTATSINGVKRALAVCAEHDVVVFLGSNDDLDTETSGLVVTLGAAATLSTTATWRFEAPLRETAPAFVQSTDSVRVLLLQAEAEVEGVVEPFLSTLRRRCAELTSYLVLHDREPVTGERLRTRVLGRGRDASQRTLNNTASATRRSLGADDAGTRLHAVSPAGLYRIHGVSCDVTDFLRLVDRARREDDNAATATLTDALGLVKGEPLAAELRGFEWFLAEGHLARLQRDGEYAALRLNEIALTSGDLDLAFWAVERGRLLDPYSEILEAALHRVPRLREFGGDGTGRAKDEAVGAR